MKANLPSIINRGCMIALLSIIALPDISALGEKEYKICVICDDNQREKFRDVQNGFCETLNKSLADVGARAVYTWHETRGDIGNVPGIIQAIKDGQPDLIAVINNSAVFADLNITTKLTDPKYRFVVEDCMPVQSGVAKTWDHPGGNVTGVGVFLRFTPMIKLAQLINPMASKLITWSWSAVGKLNEFLESEMRAAAKETGVELVEFRLVANAEDEFEYMAAMDKMGPECFAIPCMDAWVHRDGSYANMNVEAQKFNRENMRHLVQYTYDEAGVKYQVPAGTCIVWYDIGAQMAEKGYRILQGENPGDIGWDYPRKYNLMFNLEAARIINMKIPQNLINAAYRVYMDFDGHFVGKKN